METTLDIKGRSLMQLSLSSYKVLSDRDVYLVLQGDSPVSVLKHVKNVFCYFRLQQHRPADASRQVQREELEDQLRIGPRPLPRLLQRHQPPQRRIPHHSAGPVCRCCPIHTRPLPRAVRNKRMETDGCDESKCNGCTLQV